MPQSLAKVYLHVIFSTKHRVPALADEWRDELFHVLGGTTNNLGCQSLIIGGVVDHVHLLFQLGRTITIADAVGKIKSTSSLWVQQTRQLEIPFSRQGGYGAFSVDRTNVETVRDYIRRQQEHHANQSFQDEFREYLWLHGIEYDERYVWD
jgi:REP element-mobilizing transposase RayT